MYKYISVGCSFTAQDGYINFLNQNYNLNIKNYAISGGSNQLQLHRLNNALLKNLIGPDTTILWQITSSSRRFELLRFSANEYKHGVPYSDNFDWIPETVAVNDSNCLATLCNNTIGKNFFNEDYHIQNLICDIFKWSKIVKRIVLYLGWESCLAPSYLGTMNSLCNNISNVRMIPLHESILDWCANKKLCIDESRHPTKESYIEWCKAVLIPKLEISGP